MNKALTNQEAQSEIFLDNVNDLFNDMNSKGLLNLPISSVESLRIKDVLTGRVFSADRHTLETRTKLQGDLIALRLLLENGYDFNQLKQDLSEASRSSKDTLGITDFSKVLEIFSVKKSSPTDTAILDPMMNDVMKSLKTKGEEPPHNELVRAKDYIASKVASSMGTTDV